MKLIEEMKRRNNSMNVRTLLFLAGMLFSPAWLSGQEINRDFPAQPLSERVTQIAAAAQKTITFDANQISNIQAGALEAKNSSVDQVLAGSLRLTGYSFRQLSDQSYIIYRERDDDSKTGRGSISGTVLDEKQVPVTGVTVLISGTTTGTATDADGKYRLQSVPAGTIAVRFSFLSFETLEVKDVTINPGKATRLDVVMKESSEELNEVVVTANYKQASAEGLYAKQKAMVAMADGISADQIKKTSDNNIAQVLKRVAGVTIDNGKYVTVRGMSERYNNVQLNGTSLPSTEPNRRNFSFDVIPSALVDNVTISKTFTPDMSGEFTGGLVEVNTLAVPDEQFFNVTVGTGMNTQSTGKDFRSNKRYSGDWLFGNIDDRKWYTGRTETASGVNVVNAGKINNYGLQKYTAAPVQNYELTLGLPFHLGNNQKLGVMAALTYRNEQTVETIKEGHMITRDSLYKESFRNKFVTAAGAVANVGWEMPGHKITWRNLYNNRFSHTNQERYISKYYETYQFAEQYSVPLVNRLWQTQLDGEHLVSDRLKVNWKASYNKVNRTNPDDRLITGRLGGTATDGEEVFAWSSYTLISEGGTGNKENIHEGHLMYSDLEETKKNAGIDLEYTAIVAGNRQRIKAGYLGTFRKADFQQQYLKGAIPNGVNIDSLTGRSPHEFFATEHFSEGIMKYVVSGMQGDAADYYTGNQDVHAAYLMGEFSFLRKLRLTTGVRVEKAKTEVTSELLNRETGAISDSLVTLEKTDWLPGGTLVYNITNNLNARMAYSRTIARPDFRELSLCRYYNVDDRVSVVNLGAIRQSTTDNFDLRLEWYPQAGEVLSVSAFYKKFHDPVEIITQMTSSQQSFYMYPVNLDEATAKGLEFNVRKSLGFIVPGTFLKNLYVSGNATWIKGDVTYNIDRLLEHAEIQREDRSRPLVGLSPYLMNAGLAYQGNVIGVAINYGSEGRKLVTSGDYEKYDQYEESRDILDLQLSARFMREKLEVKFNAGDLLNQDIIVYRNCGYDIGDESNDGAYTDLTGLGMNYNDGDWVMSRVKKGVNLSLSVSYKF